MKIIVGLGNPGGEYKDTRHNIGFMVIDKLSKEIGHDLTWKEEPRFKSVIAKVSDVLLVKPVTFMNNSGLAVLSLMMFYKLSPKDIWVIHDDMDLPIGKIRIRVGGSSAGHNGVESIIKELKSDDFLRFRLGIGRGKEEKGEGRDKRLYQRSVVDFVLSHFSEHEAGVLKHLIKHGVSAVRIALTEGTDKAMTRFN